MSTLDPEGEATKSLLSVAARCSKPSAVVLAARESGLLQKENQGFARWSLDDDFRDESSSCERRPTGEQRDIHWSDIGADRRGISCARVRSR